MTEETVFGTAERHLIRAQQELKAFASMVGEVADPLELAYLARHLQVLRQEVSDAYRDARAATATAMGEKKMKHPWIGDIVANEGRKRVWRYDPLIATLVARLADEWGGEPPAVFAEHVAAALRRVLGFSYARVTAIEAEGLNPNDFCDWKDTGPDITLPPLGKPDDPIANSEDEAA